MISSALPIRSSARDGAVGATAERATDPSPMPAWKQGVGALAMSVASVGAMVGVTLLLLKLGNSPERAGHASWDALHGAAGFLGGSLLVLGAGGAAAWGTDQLVRPLLTR